MPLHLTRQTMLQGPEYRKKKKTTMLRAQYVRWGKGRHGMTCKEKRHQTEPSAEIHVILALRLPLFSVFAAPSVAASAFAVGAWLFCH